MSYNNGPRFVTSGLITCLDPANIKSYVSGSSTIRDLSGNINHGTITGTVYTSSNAGILIFNGTSDYVYTANGYTNPQYFTISVWFKTNTHGINGGKLIGMETVQDNSSYPTSYDRMIYIGTDDNLYFGCYDTSARVVTTSFSVIDNVWHNAAATYNGTSKDMILYLDGVQIGTTTTPATVQSYLGYWKLGGRIMSTWPNANDGFYDGKLGNCFIYNRDLTPSEILQNYNALKGRYIS